MMLAMTKRVHGLKLWRCSNFNAFILPGQCEKNRALAKRAMNGPSRRLEMMKGGLIETGENKLECLQCPGVVKRCMRERKHG